MKNMEMMRATKSTLPAETVRRANSAVSRVALRGSLASPTPAASQPLARRRGMTASRAKACRVRGATMMEPMADEIQAQARPIGMIGPHRAMRPMISGSPARSCGVATLANLKMMAM